MKKSCVPGLFPRQCEMRDISRGENDIDRTVAANLVGNENVAALSIFCRWQHGAALSWGILPAADATSMGSTSCKYGVADLALFGTDQFIPFGVSGKFTVTTDELVAQTRATSPRRGART